MSQVYAARSKWELAAIHLPRNLPVKSLTIVFVLSVLLTACAGSQVIQPGMLEGSTGMSSSLRSEQEIPKSDSDGIAPSSPGDTSPGDTSPGNTSPGDASPGDTSPNPGNGVETFNDPGAVPEKPDQESNEPPPAFVAPAVNPTSTPTEAVVALPTPTPTEAVVEPPPPPPVDLSLPVGPKIGNRAPDFTLQTMDGSTIALSDLLGKPLLINYWATWCVPCKEELPILEKLFQEYQSRGLMIVSVDAIDQDTTDKLQSVITQVGMTFPTLLDEGNQFADAYQALFFPTSFFIDPSGVIRYVTLGDSSEEVFRQKIERLLSGEF
jgi:peroxiredoxin